MATEPADLASTDPNPGSRILDPESRIGVAQTGTEDLPETDKTGPFDSRKRGASRISHCRALRVAKRWAIMAPTLFHDGFRKRT